ncbi:MAG TPA: ABC transporter permease [Solirubrobacteraceae bacterium]|jgi:peptide/nickel transport system permease protein|nr:ABC transporter permease [Solirubrobacteraceae bacterium]
MIREFRRHRLGVAGLALIGLLIAFCFLGPVIHPTDQVHANIDIINIGPSSEHLLGTDANGYDILGRLMVGGRDSLEIGVAVALLATLFGALWGAVAGLTGGALDALMMRVVDTLLALPAIFVLIYLATVVQPTVPLLIAVIALLSWLGPARLIRGETLSLRTREFVEAARSAGASRTRIVLRHLLPNTLGTLVVNATFQVADAIIVLATLSFLGFGLPPPAATWGGVLYQGTTYLFDGYWWEVYPAGILLMLTVIAFNLVGDALRETVDSRARER